MMRDRTTMTSSTHIHTFGDRWGPNPNRPGRKRTHAHTHTRTIVRLAPNTQTKTDPDAQTHRAVVIEVLGVVHGEVVLGVLPDHGGAIEPGGVVHGGVEIAVAVCCVWWLGAGGGSEDSRAVGISKAVGNHSCSWWMMI